MGAIRATAASFAALTIVGGLALTAYAGAPALVPEEVFTHQNPFRVDLDGDGIWDGNPTDAGFSIAAFAGAGSVITGDWNGDTLAGVARYVGTTFYVDLDENRAWSGNVGSDRSTSFAASFGAGTPLAGDWGGGGSDRIGVYTGMDRFLEDVNGNGLWDGTPTDANIGIASFAGAGTPLIGNFSGDMAGADDVAKYVGTMFFIDLDGDNVWDGNAGGDLARNFAGSFGAGTPLVGDWDGDGTDEIGVYVNDRFLLDLDGDGIWDGNGGGDLNTTIAAFAPTGVPIVCDLDGDGDDDIGKYVAATQTFYLDRNGDLDWDGPGGGDSANPFAASFGAATTVGCADFAP